MKIRYSWGQLLGDFLPGVTVCNHAKAGRSTKSFLAEGRLQALDGQIKPGDLVLIQFAHNDENEKPER
ncbi:MAG: pectin esterase, partial [Muribaculaceae bacterium]|nr:pectin esterase [Muribaculaceae bacterium]